MKNRRRHRVKNELSVLKVFFTHLKHIENKDELVEFVRKHKQKCLVSIETIENIMDEETE